MAPRVDPEQRGVAVARLTQLRVTGELTAGHVRLIASGLAVAERTVWRWISAGAQEQPASPAAGPVSAQPDRPRRLSRVG